MKQVAVLLALFAVSFAYEVDYAKLDQFDAANNIACSVCKATVKELESEATVDRVLAQLKSVCEKVPMFQSQCSSLAEQVLPEVAELIVSHVTPEDACTLVGMCSNDEVGDVIVDHLGAAAWQNCDSSLPFQADKLWLSPDPPVAGKTCTASVSGVGKDDVTGGKAKIVVTYAGIPAKEVTNDMCSVIVDPPSGCPVKAGTHGTAALSIDIPSFAPKGNYKATVTMTDENGQKTGCANVQFSI